jgi:hypothetical protein
MLSAPVTAGRRAVGHGGDGPVWRGRIASQAFTASGVID